ncbi:TIGR00730 family Rossman fold protein [Zavarzinia sp. CC-PAN008]|uniref:LOG family protein n=1 Tax=Zavarzinia sp. CC-PAN008 TaxID=3243332 RepID=UPI003F746348
MPFPSSLCVYCASMLPSDPAPRQEAERLGQILANNGIRLVYGGGSIGLMGVTARACLEAGGRVTGIIPTFLDEREVGLADAELEIVESMHVRKRRMVEESDGFVILPGGLGTLDETLEIITWRQLDLHDKPIVLVNIGGYWDPLVALIDNVIAKGYAKASARALFTVVAGVDDILPAVIGAPEASEKVEAERL